MTGFARGCGAATGEIYTGPVWWGEWEERANGGAVRRAPIAGITGGTNGARPRLPRMTSSDCLRAKVRSALIVSIRLTSHHSDGVSTAVRHAISFSPSP